MPPISPSKRIIPPGLGGKAAKPSTPSANGRGQLVTEALKLHDLGLWVVPCEGKKAFTPDWQKERFSRERLINLLGNGTRYNIGIVLTQSPFIDVECDSEEAEGALVSMFGGDLPPTPTWKSKRGHHRLFLRPEGLPEKATVKLDGVEFRLGNAEKGAFSVVPPSKHPDGPKYTWLPRLSIHEVEPAPLPESVVERLRSPQHPDDRKAPDGKWTIGERNDELFKLGCRLRRAKFTQQEILAALLGINQARCHPPLPGDEVDGIVTSAMKESPDATQGEILLALASKSCEFWHTSEPVAWVTVNQSGHLEHHRVRSKQFRQWLARAYYLQEKGAPRSGTMEDVLSALEAQANFEGPTCTSWLRIALHEGKVYVDLADDSWRAVEIDTEGWRIVANPPVRFRRPKGMLPLLSVSVPGSSLLLPVGEPVSGGDVAELWKFMNVPEGYRPLVLGCLIGLFSPSGPFAVLMIFGEQGSAKSTLFRVFRSLIDPNVADIRRLPDGVRNLMVAANNSWVLLFDNVSCIDSGFSDDLCTLATGGGFGVRANYTDDEEALFNAARPIGMNGISEMGEKNDLRDRAVGVELEAIDPRQRLAESVFWEKFAEAKPRLLGQLFDAVSTALRRLPNLREPADGWPRMADYAKWVEAAAPALGMKPGVFLEAYCDNREELSRMSLESSLLVTPLIEVARVRKGVYEGEVKPLWEALETCVGPDTKRRKEWPKNPRALSGKLSRLAPTLRKAGWEVSRRWVDKKKVWTIRPAKSADPNYATTQTTQKSGKVPPVGVPPSKPPHSLAEAFARLRARTAARCRGETPPP